MFTRLDIWWVLFCPSWYKINLVKTLVYWVLLICSTKNLGHEIETIRKIFGDNDYPLDIVQFSINMKRAEFHKTKMFGPHQNVLYIFFVKAL